MLGQIQAIMLMACLGACTKAQQGSSSSQYDGISPFQYSAHIDTPHWRRYNAPLARPPYSPSYHGTPNALPLSPPMATQAPAPTGFFISPYQALNNYRSLYQNSPSEISNGVVQQQHLGFRQYQQNHQIEQPRRATPAILQQQRNEGHFYRRLTSTANPSNKPTVTQAIQQIHETPQQRNSEQSVNPSRYATFEHQVLHVTTPVTPIDSHDYRKRRSFAAEKSSDGNTMKRKTNQYEPVSNDIDKAYPTMPIMEIYNAPKQQNTHHFHDIFMHYSGPQSVAYGHVEHSPLQFAQRFESLHKGNRYRGEVTWADAKTGGYGSQHWDLAQGKLSSR